MPDRNTTTYGFSFDDANSLVELISGGERYYLEGLVRRRRRRGGGRKIFFAVDSAAVAASTSPYNGNMILTVTITVAPCNQSSLIDTSVDVVDWSTCLANAETTAAVVGRHGWAFEGIAHSLKVGDPAGTLTPCHWVLDGLCCP